MSNLDIFSDLNNHKDIHNCLCLFTNFVHNGKKFLGKENDISSLKNITELKKFCIDNNGVIWFYVFNSDDEEYVKNIVQKLYDIYLKHSNNRKFISRGHNNIQLFKYTNNWDIDGIFLNIKKNMQIKHMPNFDYVIQNPPYAKTMHLDFFEKGMSLLKDTGKMVIIEPGRFLLELRETAERKTKFLPLIEKYKNNIYKIIIEMYSFDFGISNEIPCSISYIDKSKNTDGKVEAIICGDNKGIIDIYDCNLIGNRSIINSIINKILNNFTEFLDKHVDYISIKNAAYIKYTGGSCPLMNVAKHFYTGNRYGDYKNDGNFIVDSNNYNIFRPYIDIAFFKTAKISNKIENWNNYVVCELYNTYEENEKALLNFKNFIYNSKVAHFISMALNISKSNTILSYMPFIIDEITDEEIYKKCKFTKEEIKLIEYTNKKFDRYSPWFIRYATGDTSITSEEIKKYLED